jgi:hypothetical protein
MPLIKVYNNDSDPYGLKGHSIFKSVRPFIFGYAIIPKLHEWYLQHHVRAASAEAVSFRRTFDDEAWSQQGVNRRNLEIVNFEHALPPGLGLEINNREFVVRKIVPLAMSCSINADNFGSKLKTILEREL